MGSLHLIHQMGIPRTRAKRGLIFTIYRGFQILLTFVDQFTGITFTCEESDMIFGKCRYEKGEDVISAYGLDGDIRVNAVVLLGIIAFLRILAYLILLLKVRRSTESSA
jgi:hypothetical protein